MSFKTGGPAPPTGRTVSTTWVTVIALVAVGAGIAGTSTYFALNPPGHLSPGQSIAITDDLGRNVTVPIDPARIAVLSPSIMDEVYRLGLRSHVVGVDCYAAAFGGLSADYSPDQVMVWNLSASMCVQVGPTFSPEMLANLTPSLVLASTIVPIGPIEKITTQLGVPLVMLQPPTLSGILVDDSLLGEIFGVESAASALNAELSAELFHATSLAANESFPYVLVTYSDDPNGYWTFGPSTFGESLIELAGATSIAANATIPWPELSPAQILYANPSVIVYGYGFGLNESTYSGGPDWSQFGAVQAGNVSGIDSNWITEPDPTMILDGLPALIADFHPVTI